MTSDQDPPAAGQDTDAAHESGEGEQTSEPHPDFPIVGIGASAGGLAAFEAFFSGMPPDHDPGMAFVLVQHLAPDHESMLTELVKRQTQMDVFQVEDGMRVEPNCAYIIPPNRDMALADGRLRLSEPEVPRGHRLPIDFFFRSLARQHGDRAICVVLSGTGSDGTLGLRIIKGEGGMAMVQSPGTTAYAGMPRSAIGTGLVDFVLPPEEMPSQLMAYARTAFEGAPRSDHREAKPTGSPAGTPEAVETVFTLLREQTGHDFSGYKDTTVHRRLSRRMAVHQVDELGEYVRFLKASREEVEALFRDLLIGVTRFFRDPEAFQALEGAISGILTEKRAGSTLRVWVPGCSTGEEAYSIAILLRERMEAMKRTFPVKIFATDIDPGAVQMARAGVFPASVAPDLPDERLSRYFVPEANGEAAYRVRKDIREMLVFSEQDVVRDPPFSKLDLISCRNLLIYLSPGLQKKLIPRFHYALAPGGVLFLGTSESIGAATDLFIPLDRRMSVYQRLEGPRTHARPGAGPFVGPRREIPLDPPPPEEEGEAAATSLRRLTEAALLEETGAAAALVDEGGEILYVHGRTGLYLEPAPGGGGMNVLRMAREGLERELTIAFHRAKTRQERVHRAGLEVRTNGDSVRVDLVVRPVAGSRPPTAGSTTKEGSPLFLVVLKAVPSPSPEGAAAKAAEGEREEDPETAGRIALLEQELESREEYLRATEEEMQTSTEELRTSLEELQSTNEELQSTNEEMETSQEELQSLNEELSTVNAELESKVADLSRSHNDMNNLLSGTGIATVFVDQDLRIQRFTRTATQLINLIEADVGRPVGDLASKLVNYDSLAVDAGRVLETLEPMELEVQAADDRWYLLGIRPYRTVENVIEGAVITFTEITDLKKLQAAAREGEELRRLAVVVRDSNDPILSLDREGRVRTWNPAAERTYGWSEEEALQMRQPDLVPEGLRDQARSMFEAVLGGQDLAPLQTKRLTRDGSTVTIWFTATALVDGSGEAYGVSITERPVHSEPPEGP